MVISLSLQFVPQVLHLRYTTRQDPEKWPCVLASSVWVSISMSRDLTCCCISSVDGLSWEAGLLLDVKLWNRRSFRLIDQEKGEPQELGFLPHAWSRGPLFSLVCQCWVSLVLQSLRHTGTCGAFSHLQSIILSMGFPPPPPPGKETRALWVATLLKC